MNRSLRLHGALLITALICALLIPGSLKASAHPGIIFRQPSSGPHVDSPITPYNLSTVNQQVVPIKLVAFTSDGGWIVLFGVDGYSAEGLPSDLTDILDGLNQDKKEIRLVSFTVDGGWIVVSGKQGGAINGFNSKGLPQSALDKLNALNQNGFEFQDIAFSPDNEWVVLYGANRYAASKKIPSELIDKLDELIGQTRTLRQVVFTSTGKWMVLYNDNRYYASGVSKDVTDQLKKINSANQRLTHVAFVPAQTSGGAEATPADSLSDTPTPAESSGGSTLTADLWVILYGQVGVVYSTDLPSNLIDRLKELNSGVQ